MKKIIIALLLMTTFATTNAQSNNNEPAKAGISSLKFAGNLQTWARYMQYNPGSNLYGYNKDKGADVGIRRLRLNLTGQPTDKIFFYVQLGLNNFNFLSDRKAGLFVSDAVTEYKVKSHYLSIGMGLSAWSGLSRFSSPSTVSILGIDAPLFLQSTNDVTDQFFRKLSVYGKGKIGKLDYRVAFASPMAIQKSNYNTTISSNSNFSARPPKMQTNGYFQYQFKDQESNLTPYTTGTYLGKKKVFNIGAGFVYQPKAMWHTENIVDTVSTDLIQLSADVFYDAPIGKNGQAISVYGNFTHSDFGTNYYRNSAVMNPVNGVVSSNLNGSGNGYPTVGTGNSFYAQVGYKFKDNLIKSFTLLPYASVHYNKLDRFIDPVIFYDLGTSLLLNGHSSKITLAYQNRPIMNSTFAVDTRKSALLLQYQTSF